MKYTLSYKEDRFDWNYIGLSWTPTGLSASEYAHTPKFNSLKLLRGIIKFNKNYHSSIKIIYKIEEYKVN